MDNTVVGKLIVFGLVALVIGAGTVTGVGKRLGNTEEKDNLQINKTCIPEISFGRSVFQGAQIVPGEFIVQFVSSVSPDQFQINNGLVRTGISSLDAINTRYQVNGVEKIFRTTDKDDRFGLAQFYKVTLPINSDVFSVIKEYQKNPMVIFAEPNHLFQAYTVPDDPYYSSSGSWNQSYPDMWGLHTVHAQDAWNITTGSQDIVVAVVDSGVDYAHPDIAANMWINQDEIPSNGIDDDGDGFVDNMYGADFAYNDSDPMDGFGHGTHCAGTIAAVGNNDLGVVGVNWRAQIMAVKGLNDYGSGSSTSLSQALCWAADQGADVISNSWGSLDRLPYDPLIAEAVHYAYVKGCIVVFAAGNSNDDVQYYCPQNMQETIAVAATDPTDHRASFSNWGEKVDVCAPGVDILSLRANNTDFYKNGIHIVGQQYYRSNGTSMACPHAAGLVALLLAKNNSMTVDMIRTILSSTGDVIDSPFAIGRRLNASAALLREPAVAMLQSIPRWTDVKGLFLVNGSASGSVFLYYVVEYQSSNGSGLWVELLNSTTAVNDGVLAVMDTTMYPEGTYQIRLRLICADGTYEDDLKIVVNNQQNHFYVDDDNIHGPWDGTSKHPYRYINNAVAVSGDGDSVFVRMGTYSESVSIDRSIKITGEYTPRTFINGVTTNTDAFVVNADNVCISGFTFRNAKNAIFFSYMTNGTAQANVFVNNSNAVVSTTCDHCHVVGNSMSGNGNVDIGFNEYSYDNIVSGNTIAGGNCGIILYDYCWNNSIIGNTIIGSSYGIYFADCAASLIQGNYVQNCSIWGISIGNGLFFNVLGNTIINSQQLGTGMQLCTTTNSTFMENTITGYYNGIFSYADCANNQLFHNNFLNNRYHVWDLDLGVNLWDDGYPAGGNYWSDYTGSDHFSGPNQDVPGADGIGDTLKVVPNGNQDRYPFMCQNGWAENPPDAPLKPSGRAKGIRGTIYTYSTLAIDPNGDNVSYLWDWGDGNMSGWMGSYPSDTEVFASHIWPERGSYAVKVKAKDIHDTESSWSVPLIVSVCKLGDVNNDGVVSWRDIDPFVSAMNSNESVYEGQHPDWVWIAADCNQDGVVSWRDINPFVALMNT